MAKEPETVKVEKPPLMERIGEYALFTVVFSAVRMVFEFVIGAIFGE